MMSDFHFRGRFALAFLTAALLALLIPTQANARCASGNDCKFDRRCVDGACVTPELALPPQDQGTNGPDVEAREDADTSPDEDNGWMLRKAYGSLLDAGSNIAVVLLVWIFVIVNRNALRRRRRVFTDKDGHRVLVSALVMLESGASFSDFANETGDLLARCLEFEKFLEHRRSPKTSEFPAAAFSALVTHPRFDELAALAWGKIGSSPSFPRCRAIATS